MEAVVIAVFIALIVTTALLYRLCAAFEKRS
jgi:hypothetical protein